MRRPLTLSLGSETDYPITLVVDENGTTRLKASAPREVCPHCNDEDCQTTCIDSIPEPGEDIDSDIFDRIAHNGRLDGVESAFLAMVSSFKMTGLLEGNAERMANLAKAFDIAWTSSLDAIANHAD